jgi:hypothetical protein
MTIWIKIVGLGPGPKSDKNHPLWGNNQPRKLGLDKLEKCAIIGAE